MTQPSQQVTVGKIAEKTKDEGVSIICLLNGVQDRDFLFMRKPFGPLCKDPDLPVLNFSVTITILLGMGLWETIDRIAVRYFKPVFRDNVQLPQHKCPEAFETCWDISPSLHLPVQKVVGFLCNTSQLH